MYCRHCGRQIEDGARFCEYCGQLQDGNDIYPSNDSSGQPDYYPDSQYDISQMQYYDDGLQIPNPQKPGGGGWIGGAVVIAMALLIGGLVFAVFSGGGAPDDDNAVAAAETSAQKEYESENFDDGDYPEDGENQDLNLNNSETEWNKYQDSTKEAERSSSKTETDNDRDDSDDDDDDSDDERDDDSEENKDESAHTYSLYLDDCSWSEAFSKAKKAGGHLATFESIEEYERVLRQIESEGLKNYQFRIGGIRNGSGYYWIDENGAPTGGDLTSSSSWAIQEDIWLDGEPSYDDHGVREEVLDIIYLSTYNAFVLNDVANDVAAHNPEFAGKFGYIVEFE